MIGYNEQINAPSHSFFFQAFKQITELHIHGADGLKRFRAANAMPMLRCIRLREPKQDDIGRLSDGMLFLSRRGRPSG